MAAKHRARRIWQQRRWPDFTWDAAVLLAPLAAARRLQGECRGRTLALAPDPAVQRGGLSCTGRAQPR